MEEKIINDLILELNEEWFKAKKEAFQKEPNYVNERIIIVETLIDFEEEGEEIKRIETKNENEIDLNEYCWNGNFPGSREEEMERSEDAHYKLPQNGNYYALKILSFVKISTEDFIEPKAINSFIVSVIGSVKSKILELLSDKEDREYESSLEYFFLHLRKLISKNYSHIKRQVDLIGHTEYLDFNLKQEELAAVLFIMNKAGFINSLNYNDDSFINFCSQYFRFKFKDGYKLPTSSKTLKDKYKEFIRHENGKLLERIKKKLSDIIKEV